MIPGLMVLILAPRSAHVVKRNRVRRRLREIYRLNERRFVRGLDMVIVVRGRGVDAPYRALEEEVLTLAGKLEALQ